MSRCLWVVNDLTMSTAADSREPTTGRVVSRVFATQPGVSQSRGRLARLARTSCTNEPGDGFLNQEEHRIQAAQGEATRLWSTLANVDLDQLRWVATPVEAG
jgi:hypothetical protein